MAEKKRLLIAFYGDDLTGSTDALEMLASAGKEAILFLDTPTDGMLVKYENLDAIGIAGTTRAMTPPGMKETLEAAFSVLKTINPEHVHYKVCSTFDSSIGVGNIGTAIETGMAMFGSPFVPVLVAAPALGRYSVFGNLFARMGIGSANEVYRLDRHPSMTSHPVTPAKESDLRLHLAEQTNLNSGLVDLLTVRKGPAAVLERIKTVTKEGAEVVFFDAFDEDDMTVLGKTFADLAGASPVFSVGSSGVEQALSFSWKATVHTPEPRWETLPEGAPLLVGSGSCSPVTKQQIKTALEAGFVEVVVEMGFKTEIAEYVGAVVDALRRKKSVILHSGPVKQEAIDPNALGEMLGTIIRTAAAETCITRIVVAGGDTSSYTGKAMGVESVRMVAPFAAGAPWCKAFAPGSPLEGVYVNFKGGQVGTSDYFIRAAGLSPPTNHSSLITYNSSLITHNPRLSPPCP